MSHPGFTVLITDRSCLNLMTFKVSQWARIAYHYGCMPPYTFLSIQWISRKSLWIWAHDTKLNVAMRFVYSRTFCAIDTICTAEHANAVWSQLARYARSCMQTTRCCICCFTYLFKLARTKSCDVISSWHNAMQHNYSKRLVQSHDHGGYMTSHVTLHNVWGIFNATWPNKLWPSGL